jgi:hypothetical protein
MNNNNNNNNNTDFNYEFDNDFNEEIRPADSVRVERLIDDTSFRFNNDNTYNHNHNYNNYENDIQTAIQNSLLNYNLDIDMDLVKAIEASSTEFEYKEEERIKEFAEKIEERKNTFIKTKQQLNRLILFDNILNKAYYELLLNLIELYENNIQWELGITSNYYFSEDELKNISNVLKNIRIPENELCKLKQLIWN